MIATSIRDLGGMIDSLRAVGPTVGANLVNQAVVALSQLALIPLLVGAWGIEGYGNWLLLSAVPTYLTISDLGFTTSAKSDMAMRVARRDLEGARVTASSVAALLAVALALIGVVYLGLVCAVDWATLLNLAGIPNGSARTVLALGFVQIASYQAFLLSAGVVRAAGRPATEVLLSAATRAIETIALAAAAWLGGDIVTAALAWTAARAGATLCIWIAVAARQPRLAPTVAKVKLDRIRSLLKPSLAYVALPLANAISIQGTVLVLGAFAGPAAVAAFTATRIVTRLGVSAANTLNYAFTPQYSYAIGRDDKVTLRRLARLHAGMIASGCALFVVLALLLAPWVIRALAHGSIEPAAPILLMLVLAAALEMMWSAMLALRSASNKVGRIAISWLAIALVSVGALLLMQHDMQLPDAAGVTLAAHLSVAICVYLAGMVDRDRT